jgi:cytochrome P450
VVLLGSPAANRDPAVVDDADTFIIDRAINRHAAFGLGIHRCVAIEEFMRRYPAFELSDSATFTGAPGQLRGPLSLHVTSRA